MAKGAKAGGTPTAAGAKAKGKAASAKAKAAVTTVRKTGQKHS